MLPRGLRLFAGFALAGAAKYRAYLTSGDRLSNCRAATVGRLLAASRVAAIKPGDRADADWLPWRISATLRAVEAMRMARWSPDRRTALAQPSAVQP